MKRLAGELGEIGRRTLVVFLFLVLPLSIAAVGLVQAGRKAFWWLLGVAVFFLSLGLLARLLPNRPSPKLVRAVQELMPNRPALTPEQFAARYYPPELQETATRLRELLDGSMGFAISGLEPQDDFLAVLRLDGTAGMDSTEEGFFEEVAVEFGLKFKGKQPEEFESFDHLLRYVAAGEA